MLAEGMQALRSAEWAVTWPARGLAAIAAAAALSPKLFVSGSRKALWIATVSYNRPLQSAYNCPKACQIKIVVKGTQSDTRSTLKSKKKNSNSE